MPGPSPPRDPRSGSRAGPPAAQGNAPMSESMRRPTGEDQGGGWLPVALRVSRFARGVFPDALDRAAFRRALPFRNSSDADGLGVRC